MSCCGQKRQSWALENSVAMPDQTVERVGSKKEPVATRFRYTGAGSLVVYGVFARNLYRFSTTARESMILPEDVQIMRGHPELTEVRNSA